MSAVLIRRTVVRADGARERIESELDVAQVTIGSSPDNVIQLPGLASAHARLSPGKGHARLHLTGTRRVRINGVERRGTRVRPGDRIEIEGHLIEILPAPDGFDLAVDVQASVKPEDDDEWARGTPTSLQETGLDKRRWVWRISGLVVLLSLVMPFFFSQLMPRTVFQPARAFTDAVWSTGALSSGHQFEPGNECSSCHTSLFRRVKDNACRQCHDPITDHAAAATFAANDFLLERCASCHREHNEPSTLLATGDDGCLSCHARSGGVKAHSGVVRAVRGFATGTHPQFDITIPVYDETADVSAPWKTRVTSIVGARDDSNLKFPHDTHLDSSKVSELRSDDILSCASCHEPAIDGEHFVPIQMEQRCANCHELGFDDADPSRRLPHGDAREAILVMEGHFLKKALAPPPARLDGFKWRRIPDRPPRRSSDCARGDIACATRLFLAEATDQFENTGCVTCHVVEAGMDATHVPDRYHVVPVRLADDYLPNAGFDHTAHRVMGDKTGEQACLECHPANRSREASDVLIPAVETCFRCHGDSSVRSRATMSCTDCHGYHPRHPPPGPGKST